MIEAQKSIDNLAANFFKCFDNRASQVPDFDLFASCFVEGSVIGNRTSSEVNIWSLTDFWKPRAELLTSGRLAEFHEWEVEADTSIYDGIAVRQSTYQKEGILDGSPYAGEGTKCFQFALTPDGWRMTYVLWEDQE